MILLTLYAGKNNLKRYFINIIGDQIISTFYKLYYAEVRSKRGCRERAC